MKQQVVSEEEAAEEEAEEAAEEVAEEEENSNKMKESSTTGKRKKRAKAKAFLFIINLNWIQIVVCYPTWDNAAFSTGRLWAVFIFSSRPLKTIKNRSKMKYLPNI